MTLTTLVATTWYDKPEKMLNTINQKILKTKTTPKTRQTPLHIENLPDQGYPARIKIFHNNGQNFIWEEYAHGEKIPNETIKQQYTQEVKNYPQNIKTVIFLDTIYDLFNKNNTFTAGDTHAALLGEIYKTITKPTNNKMFWQDEYSGQWYPELENLNKLSQHSNQAQTLFTEKIIPALKNLGYNVEE